MTLWKPETLLISYQDSERKMNFYLDELDKYFGYLG